MRIYITILICILFVYSKGYAQNLYIKEKVLTKNNTYIVNHGSASIAVYNTSNVLLEKKHKVPTGNLTQIELKNHKSLLNSFQSVFSKERLQELLPENGIATGLFVNPAGKVLEVVFFLSKDTKVTPFELEALETEIKKNVVFNFNPEQTKGGNFFTLTKMNKYQKILDGTLEWD